MPALLRRLWADEAGATMVEYAFMVLLIATACLGAVAVFGQSVLGLFTTVPAAL